MSTPAPRVCQETGIPGPVNWARFVLHNVSSLPPPETARLYLVLSSCFRIESSPVLDRDKALFYLEKTISYSREHGLEDVLKEALKIQKAASRIKNQNSRQDG